MFIAVRVNFISALAQPHLDHDLGTINEINLCEQREQSLIKRLDFDAAKRFVTKAAKAKVKPWRHLYSGARCNVSQLHIHLDAVVVSTGILRSRTVCNRAIHYYPLCAIIFSNTKLVSTFTKAVWLVPPQKHRRNRVSSNCCAKSASSHGRTLRNQSHRTWSCDRCCVYGFPPYVIKLDSLWAHFLI